MKFNKIAIIGVGLIGGSVGLAAKKFKIARTVCGVGRRLATLKIAKHRGAVDTITLDLAEGLKGADLAILATPISLMPVYANQIASNPGMAKNGLIITDVGSTKHFIVSELERILPKGIHFVGAHPFAGSQKAGAANASRDLLRYARVFLTPTDKTNKAALSITKKFWEAVGCNVFVVSTKAHDRIVAQISHMPHIAAAALVNSTDTALLPFASTGFFDTTRIASADPLIWRDICLSNTGNILNSIRRLQRSLAVLSKAIRDKDVRVLMKELQKAKQKREGINT